jgi:putative Holliday junction resolvase
MAEKLSVLGLDVGDRRIGIAGCDGTGLLASGLDTIHRSTLAADIAALQAWIDRRQAQRLVVGLPRNMNGSIGFQARKVKRFVKAVTVRIAIPVDFVDERLSSVQARWYLQAMGISTRGQRERVDRAAAAVILQQWLDERRQQADL